MKTVIYFLLIHTLQICNLHSQTYSDITYDAGSSIHVGNGADICATNIYINGTWSGTGTICHGVLPVSISDFTYSVVKQTVKLSWVTEWEINNFGFDIERKINNLSDWLKIGFVEGNGTTNERKVCSFNDINLKSGKYEYRLKQVDFNGHCEYFGLMQEIVIPPPKSFEMGQNYPNPGNPKTKIKFELPIDCRVTLKVYDITGREVITLVDENRNPDFYTIEFDGELFASGVYFYRITSEGNGMMFSKTMKMILLK